MKISLKLSHAKTDLLHPRDDIEVEQDVDDEDDATRQTTAMDEERTYVSVRQLNVDKEDEGAELAEPETASLQRRSTQLDVRQLIVDKEDEGAELAEPEPASLQRRSTQLDVRQLIVENEKVETIEDAIRRPTSPATPKRGKRPTIAQLREMNRALKPVAPVPSTLHRTEAVMDLSVLDLETKTEAEEEESQSEISNRAIPSSDATISFDKI